ncbi:MAG: OsmC family protein [Thaumarchaeota archaeon]|nr:OsmC family protein [Nitrososphaerota archaeon]
MTADERLIDTIKEHVRKRHEASDKEFLFGAERVDLRRVDHLKMEARKRDFVFIVDEPAERGGTDQGPNPLAYFLAGAASCLMNQYSTAAIAKGISLDDLQMTARGHFDRRIGGAFDEMIYDVRVSSNAPRDAIVELAKEAQDMCYAHNTLRKAGLTLKTNLYLNGDLLD